MFKGAVEFHMCMCVRVWLLVPAQTQEDKLIDACMQAEKFIRGASDHTGKTAGTQGEARSARLTEGQS